MVSHQQFESASANACGEKKKHKNLLMRRRSEEMIVEQTVDALETEKTAEFRTVESYISENFFLTKPSSKSLFISPIQDFKKQAQIVYIILG
jgi:hypothetical protein